MAAASGWSSTAAITDYFSWTHTVAYLRISSAFNPDGCASPDMLYIDTNDANFKTVWSIACRLMPQVRAVAVPAIW
jgi:hypothetical protein